MTKSEQVLSAQDDLQVSKQDYKHVIISFGTQWKERKRGGTKERFFFRLFLDVSHHYHWQQQEEAFSIWLVFNEKLGKFFVKTK